MESAPLLSSYLQVSSSRKPPLHHCNTTVTYFPIHSKPLSTYHNLYTLYLYGYVSTSILPCGLLSSWRAGPVRISSPLQPRTQHSNSIKYLAQSSFTNTHWWMDERMTSVLCLCLESVLVGTGAANRARSRLSIHAAPSGHGWRPRFTAPCIAVHGGRAFLLEVRKERHHQGGFHAWSDPNWGRPSCMETGHGRRR